MKRLALVMALACAATLGAQGPDRTAPPRVGPIPELKLPAIQKRQLSNGLPVWIVEVHEVPMVQVSLVVFSGSADDPTGKYGVGSLTAAMLEEGAGTRSALEFADAVDFLGADLSSGTGVDSTTVRLNVPVAHLKEALALMADEALRPTFPAEELERQRQERLTDILQARDDPATIAALAFSRTLYGPTHRFGTATAGTADTIAAFKTDDLRAFYTAIFRPENAALVVVGDVTPDVVLPMLESSFGAWKASGTAPAHVKLPATAERKQRIVYLVDKPGAPQTQIRIGTVGVSRSTPDYFPIQVLNTILGGSFTSRLNNNLRETHGYAYSAGSSFDMRVEPGPFAAAASVQTDKTAEALQEFFNELNGILKPVPAEELMRAKNYITLRFPASFETTSAIARRLEDALVYHLPDNYFDTYIASIEAVTAADVARVAQKYIRPDRMAVVVVGDRKTIESRIRSANLGRITIITIDEIFGALKR